MEKKELHIDDQKICFYDTEYGRRTLLFIHGNSLSSDTFFEQFRSRDLSGYRLMAFDLPGHGNSGPAPDPENGYSLPGLSALLLKFMEKLALEECVLAGHSLGGHIILDSLPRLSPVRGIMVFGTPPIGLPPEIDRYYLSHPGLAVLNKPELSEEETRIFLEGCIIENGVIPDQLADIFYMSSSEFRRHFVASLGMGMLFDEVKHLDKNGKPVAVLHGEGDRYVNIDYINTLNIPNLWLDRVHVIRDAGHIPQMENPEAFNSMLLDYLHFLEE